MPRATMAKLISRVRLLSGAAVGDFTDDEVQAFLDARRWDVRYLQLADNPTPPAFTYTLYSAPLEYWEDGAKLYDVGYVEKPVTTDDGFRGQWTLTTSTYPPVSIVGSTYDVHAAAADLLEAWAAKVALHFDFETDGQSFKRAQKADALRKAASRERAKARIGSAPMSRSDER